MVIGIVAGGGCYWACTTLKLWLGYDDSLDVSGVHGVGGIIGTLLAGVFATATVSIGPDSPQGLPGLIDGSPRQVLIQLAGIAVTVAWAGVLTFVILKLVGVLTALRVPPEAADGSRRDTARRIDSFLSIAVVIQLPQGQRDRLA